ncbi:hypothetical protein [Paraburkholderia sp. CI3]
MKASEAVQKNPENPAMACLAGFFISDNIRLQPFTAGGIWGYFRGY